MEVQKKKCRGEAVMKALTVGNGSRNRKEGIACGVLCVFLDWTKIFGSCEETKIHARVVVIVDDKAHGWWLYGEIGTLLRFLEYIILRVLFVPAFHVFIYGG